MTNFLDSDAQNAEALPISTTVGKRQKTNMSAFFSSLNVVCVVNPLYPIYALCDAARLFRADVASTAFAWWLPLTVAQRTFVCGVVGTATARTLAHDVRFPQSSIFFRVARRKHDNSSGAAALLHEPKT